MVVKYWIWSCFLCFHFLLRYIILIHAIRRATTDSGIVEEQEVRQLFTSVRAMEFRRFDRLRLFDLLSIVDSEINIQPNEYGTFQWCIDD